MTVESVSGADLKEMREIVLAAARLRATFMDYTHNGMACGRLERYTEAFNALVGNTALGRYTTTTDGKEKGHG